MKQKPTSKEILEKVNALFFLAENIFPKSPEKANKLVAKARVLAMKSQFKLPSEFKRRFCRHCHSFLVPGKNLRIRTREGKLVYFCTSCKKFWRKPLNN